MSKTVDIVIVGSGFAGSLLGIILQKSGLKVTIIESGSHPRFAVGESSTPIADMILRDLARDYDLPWLAPFSRYGTWLETYPEITCGLKRGFSYFFHEPGKPFMDNAKHDNALMVAASVSDEQSDTQWLRSEFDAFLADKAGQAGVCFWDNSQIIKCERINNENWDVLVRSQDRNRRLSAGYIIDATGSSQFASQHFGAAVITNEFETRSGAVFSHFDSTGLWMEHLDNNDIPVIGFPYHPDYSALHHVIEEGWVWMLRFNNNRLSAGVVLELNQNDDISLTAFEETIARYPSLERIFSKARLSAVPGKLIKADRLQRRLERGFGDGWMALGNTIGFIDPLHSTGIAHSLTQLEKIAITVKTAGLRGLNSQAKVITDGFNRELYLIDRLVASCYHARFNRELYRAAVMLYFVCSVTYEQRRLGGHKPENYLCADQPELVEMVEMIYKKLRKWRHDGCNETKASLLAEGIRRAIKPWNTVGLMDKTKKNMYRHTAVEL